MLAISLYKPRSHVPTTSHFPETASEAPKRTQKIKRELQHVSKDAAQKWPRYEGICYYTVFFIENLLS